MRMLWMLVLTSLLLSGIAVRAQEEGNCSKSDSATRPDCAQAKAFFSQLQLALSKDDRNAVASMIRYPLRTNNHGKAVLIRNRIALLSQFHEVFNSGVRCTISRAKVMEVWGNWQGFTIKQGTVWFDGVIPKGATVNINDPDYRNKYPLKIKTVNHGATSNGCE